MTSQAIWLYSIGMSLNKHFCLVIIKVAVAQSIALLQSNATNRDLNICITFFFGIRSKLYRNTAGICKGGHPKFVICASVKSLV